MNFGEIKTLARVYVPGSKGKKIEIDEMELILKMGSLYVANEVGMIEKNVKFNIEANKEEYTISDIATDYLRPAEAGLWYYLTSAWYKLNPVTKELLDKKHRNWRDFSAGTPERYDLISNTLLLNPKASSDITNGGWLYYIASPTNPTSDNHYMFTGTVRVSQYEIFEECVLLYWKWIAYSSLGKESHAKEAKAELQSSLLEKKYKYFERRDIEASEEMKLTGPSTRGAKTK